MYNVLMAGIYTGTVKLPQPTIAAVTIHQKQMNNDRKCSLVACNYKNNNEESVYETTSTDINEPKERFVNTEIYT